MSNEHAEDLSSAEQFEDRFEDDLHGAVAKLTERVEDLEDERDELAERVEDLEDERDELAERVEDLEDDKERNQRTRASVSRLINGVRDLPDAEGIDAESTTMVAEAANSADELHDTIERARENSGLLNFREKRPESASVNEKYLRVLGRAEEKADEIENNIVHLDYREVATHYGCAYKNDGYRVMEEMEERVPGVEYVEARKANPEVDPTTTVAGKSIRVEWEHPELRAWVRAHREER